MAEELGWSHKHLIAQFRDQLGTPPKRLGRVLRFQRAIERIGDTLHEIYDRAAHAGTTTLVAARELAVERSGGLDGSDT